MAYITQQQFIDAFGEQELAELTGDEAPPFDRLAADASSLVDGYVGTRYALPLATVPAIVVGWTLDITRYKLYDERAPDEVRRRYEDALAQLRDLARGVVALPPDTAGSAPSVSFATDGYSAPRLFTSDTLTDF